MTDISCIFCKDINKDRVIENQYCYGRWDKFPVSTGHLLIIPIRHYGCYFDSSADEVKALWALINEGKEIIDKLHGPDAYNIGVNVGEHAGQTIPHIHIHLIPRYEGDVEDPRGGIRGVIPGKQRY